MLKSRAAERSAPDESVEAVRRRARYRLVGALVLVVVGVVGFPLVFDTQPRPIDQDLAIVIPDKNQVAPLTVSPQPTPAVVEAQPATAPAPAQAEAKAPPAAEPPSEAPKPQAQVEPKAEVKPAASAPAKAETKPEPKPAPQPAATSKRDEASRARAILEGKSSSIKDEGQWVVQVGAYSDEASITRVRRMLEAGGLKTFTQAVPTKAGDVTRVRLGPYATTAEAERAQAKANTLGFTGAKVLKP